MLFRKWKMYKTAVIAEGVVMAEIGNAVHV